MFAIIATLVFTTAFILSAGVIATMFAAYCEKMVAALLFQPIPQTPPVYQVEIRRRRVRPMATTMLVQPIQAARAA